jgi:CSLREA domain-containing protein
LGLLWLLAGPAGAATFVVNSTGDAGDNSAGDGVCNDGSGNCTLRAAIEEANALAGADVINFSITGGGPHTFTPASAYPTITGQVTIDGTTEPDYVSTPVVELNGTSAGAASGLSITAGSSTVKGLAINRFSASGIVIGTNGSNIVEGCFIGTDVNGTADLGNTQYGVYINKLFRQVASRQWPQQ